MRYKVDIYLIHADSSTSDSTKLGSFQTNHISGIKNEVLQRLQLLNIKFEGLIEAIDYYAAIRVSGHKKGTIVDVCIEELQTSLIDELNNEFA